MSGWLLLLWLGVILQRIAELRLASRNARWMKRQGGYEVGKEHYPLILLIHIAFFTGIFLEVTWLDKVPPIWWPMPFSLFILTQVLRIWCIRSLGRYWNTGVWILPGHSPQVRGPYQFLRHPNYVAVILEILLLPLIFGAYMTAGIVTLLNALILLFVRIPVEERALTEATLYAEKMGEKHRFLPSFFEVRNIGIKELMGHWFSINSAQDSSTYKGGGVNINTYLRKQRVNHKDCHKK